MTEQKTEFETLAEPLITWLNLNHPEDSLITISTGAAFLMHTQASLELNL